MLFRSNKGYSITIDTEKGELNEFSVCGKPLIQSVSMPLFSLRLRDEDGKNVDVNTYSATICETLEDTNERCVFKYSGFADVSIEVLVLVKFTECISWRIFVKNLSPLCIEYIDFPLFEAENYLRGSGGDAEIFWGFNEGMIIDDISLREKSWFYSEDPAYPCKGTQAVFPGAVEMPFMAYYGENYGLYMAAHDNAGNMKGIDFRRVNNGVLLRFRVYTGCDFGQDFDMDYDIVMQAFVGDWHDAADIYRNWFELNKSPEFKKIEENPIIPEWYGDSPVILTYPVRGKHDIDEMKPNKMFPYMNGMEHINRFAEKLDSRIMSILMHWEGTAPWAPPVVWPPYGGEELLRDFADALHEKGHLLGLYCSGTGYTIQSNLVDEYNCQKQFEEENLKDAMCVSPTGELGISNICTAQRSGYDMCCAHQYTSDILTDQAKKMVDGGADYVQILDQNHGGTPWFCYSKEHGHPYAPGKWQTDAMNAILERINETVNQNGRRILFGCESAAAETYIPQLLFSDNRYNIDYQFGTPVPAYAYVYHEYVNNFSGNQVCANEMFDHIKSPDNILYRLAYSLTAGDMLTLVLNENGDIAFNWGERSANLPPKQEGIVRFVANGNAWRKYNGKPFWHTGRMIKPAIVELPKANEIVLKNDTILYADKLLTSRWISQDGRDAQFLVNYNDETVTCYVIAKDDANYLLFDEPSGASKAVTPLNGKIWITVKPFSTVMLEKVGE